jgi:LmbE family N-acetylglucosaminyl deacetylase
MNRSRMVRERQARIDRGEEVDWDPEAPMDDGNPLGSTEEEISWEVDVSAFVEQRRAAARAHASQSDTEWMRTMSDEEFATMFGAEYYIEPGRAAPMTPGWPFQPPE